jgi:hypothetical protein
MKLHEIANQSKQLTPKQTKWLSKYVKGTWKMNEAGLVDVEGRVVISKASTQIPIGFGHVSESFDCSDTNITSLAGAPQSVGGSFDCSDTRITSLAGAPQSVGGNFYCYNTKITSLEGAPRSVGRSFGCNSTNITSLAGAPQSVGGGFYCVGTQLVNHLLAFFRTSGIKSVYTGDLAADAILNKYLGSTDRDMLLCQDELIDAGFGDKARL